MTYFSYWGTTREQREIKRLKKHTKVKVRILILKEKKKLKMKEEKENMSQLENLNFKINLFLSREENIFKGINNFLKISCADAFKKEKGILFFIEKRDTANAANIKAFWNNKISGMFWTANDFLNKLNYLDEQNLEITKDELKEILDKKSEEYGIKFYRKPK